MQFFSFPLRNMFPFSEEIYFYKSLIFHRIIQGKNFQDIIKCFSPDFIQEIKTIITASDRLQFLNWMPRVEKDFFPNSFCIFYKLNWWRHSKRVKIKNIFPLDVCCNPVRSIANFIIQINYATSCFMQMIF